MKMETITLKKIRTSSDCVMKKNQMKNNVESDKQAYKSEDVPDDIMFQVDSLFKSLDSLPLSAKDAVMTKIKLQLGFKNISDTPQLNLACDENKKKSYNNKRMRPKARAKLKKKYVRKKGPIICVPSNTSPSVDERGKMTTRSLLQKQNLGTDGAAGDKLRANSPQKSPKHCEDGKKEEIVEREREDEVDYNADSDLIEICEDILDDEEWTVDSPDGDTQKKKIGKAKALKKRSENPTCDVCGKSFSQRSGLYTHMKRHNGEKPFKCAYCDYSSVAKIDIIRHIPIHTGNKNFTCEFCGKLFSTEVRVKTHINNVHERKRQEVCHICGFITHSRDIMRRHNIVKHTQQERIECPVCHEIIKQKGTFQIHMRRHTGLRPYTCPTCNKTFASCSRLAAHKRSHMDGQHPCPECGHQFKSKSHLQRHLVVHTGAKPFSCHLCDYACNVKGNITKHVRAVHHIMDYTMREAQPKATDSTVQLNPEALKKGVEVAELSLKEVSARTGEELTLEDLVTKDKEKVKEHDNSPKKKKKTKVARVGFLESDSNDLLPDSRLKKESATQNAKLQADVLSHAMNLLTSGSSHTASDDVIEKVIEATSENELLPQTAKVNNEYNPAEVPVDGCDYNPMGVPITWAVPTVHPVYVIQVIKSTEPMVF